MNIIISLFYIKYSSIMSLRKGEKRAIISVTAILNIYGVIIIIIIIIIIIYSF